MEPRLVLLRFTIEIFNLPHEKNISDDYQTWHCNCRTTMSSVVTFLFNISTFGNKVSVACAVTNVTKEKCGRIIIMTVKKILIVLIE